MGYKSKGNRAMGSKSQGGRGGEECSWRNFKVFNSRDKQKESQLCWVLK